MPRFALPDAVAAAGFFIAGMLAFAPIPAEAQSNAAKRAWKNVPIEEWQPSTAASVMDLAAPATRGFPESLEGNPRLSVELAKSESGDSLVLAVLVEGLADDSVGAEQYRLEVFPADGGGWKVEHVGKRWQCRRGITKGQWTTSLCP